MALTLRRNQLRYRLVRASKRGHEAALERLQGKGIVASLSTADSSYSSRRVTSVGAQKLRRGV
eukprot:9199983-Alexandrium_andersonii.AAC.1